MLKIVIVEDDTVAVKAFINYADTLEDIEIVCTCNSAAEAVKTITDHLPHAVILDLELQRGAGSGLDVLTAIHGSALRVKPFFLITTVNTSNAVYDYARSMGADYILYKHQGGYSEQYAIDLLRHMRDTILAAYGSPQGILPTTEPPAQRQQRIRSRIKTEMLNVGISPKMQGYTYLIDAIELFIQEPQQRLATIIAKKYGKAKASVEKAMETAINKAWMQTDTEILLRHYTAKIHPEKGVPTVMEFICYFADKLRDEY